MESKVIDAKRDLLGDVFDEAPRNGIRYQVLFDNDGSIRDKSSSLEYLGQRNLFIVRNMLRNSYYVMVSKFHKIKQIIGNSCYETHVT